ncbi:hypothetical protein NQ314_007232 [Rhamnusium bicolor]|uniref:V-SNARE coiled-coil homology domain-containing protein n=1 Tax=Rhamnusium bicolor TaxID=1586634 RepID=A0AAV8YSJ1_9CUCU|nr:hypothetical protein NQ314_007232 [Rhamnusium bicolor]
MPTNTYYFPEINMENQQGPGASRSPSKLEQAQQQVNEVVGIMRVNVEKVLERDQKLSELDSRADALQEGGKRFEQQAQKLKRKYWWKNIKMMLIMGAIGVVVLIIIIVSITNPMGGDDSGPTPTEPPKAIAQSDQATNLNLQTVFHKYINFTVKRIINYCCLGIFLFLVVKI